MPSEKQIKNQSKQVKKLMKEQHYFFIRNNEKFRKKLEMNRRQLSFTINYLNRTGFLKPWSRKIYQIMHNWTNYISYKMINEINVKIIIPIVSLDE